MNVVTTDTCRAVSSVTAAVAGPGPDSSDDEGDAHIHSATLDSDDDVGSSRGVRVSHAERAVDTSNGELLVGHIALSESDVRMVSSRACGQR